MEAEGGVERERLQRARQVTPAHLAQQVPMKITDRVA